MDSCKETVVGIAGFALTICNFSFKFQATLSPFNQSTFSGKLPYQRCLIPNIPGDVQHTVRDVTNRLVLPLDILLALLSFTCNCLVLTAILRTRSLQHPSLLLLCSLSITDVLWAIFTIVKNTVTFTLEYFCPEGLGATGQGFVVLCMISTLGNLAIISRDRFLAVSKPWQYRNHVTRSRAVREMSVIWILSLIMAGIVACGVYFPLVVFLSRVVGTLLYALYILITICSYIGIFIANTRHRTTMNQRHGGQTLAILQREKKLANTVGLILIVLCFTFLPALIAPIALLLAGYSSIGLIPFRPFYHVFITLNGFLNPLLNYGRNGDVRRAVRGLIMRPQCIARIHPSHTEGNGLNQNN